ncbi:unnamed protein product, partial [marine sediment metagenome]
ETNVFKVRGFDELLRDLADANPVEFPDPALEVLALSRQSVN